MLDKEHIKDYRGGGREYRMENGMENGRQWDGWLGMYNDETDQYKGNYEYFHLEFSNMKEMESVRLDDPDFAYDYLSSTHHKVPHQMIYMDMEQVVGPKTINKFADMFGKFDHLEQVALVFYENQHLDHKTFQRFCGAL